MRGLSEDDRNKNVNVIWKIKLGLEWLEKRESLINIRRGKILVKSNVKI